MTIAQSDIFFAFVEKKCVLVEEVWVVQSYIASTRTKICPYEPLQYLSESCSPGLLCFLVWPPVVGSVRSHDRTIRPGSCSRHRVSLLRGSQRRVRQNFCCVWERPVTFGDQLSRRHLQFTDERILECFRCEPCVLPILPRLARRQLCHHRFGRSSWAWS